MRAGVARLASGWEERAARDRRELRDLLDTETQDLGRRLDKCNIERLNDSADLQAKLCLLGRSASRHLESLKGGLARQAGALLELAGKQGSVLFSAYRDSPHSNSEQSHLTFSGCSVSQGGGLSAGAGLFQCPEAGTYLFCLTAQPSPAVPQSKLAITRSQFSRSASH